MYRCLVNILVELLPTLNHFTGFFVNKLRPLESLHLGLCVSANKSLGASVKIQRKCSIESDVFWDSNWKSRNSHIRIKWRSIIWLFMCECMNRFSRLSKVIDSVFVIHLWRWLFSLRKEECNHNIKIWVQFYLSLVLAFHFYGVVVTAYVIFQSAFLPLPHFIKNPFSCWVLGFHFFIIDSGTENIFILITFCFSAIISLEKVPRSGLRSKGVKTLWLWLAVPYSSEGLC